MDYFDLQILPNWAGGVRAMWSKARLAPVHTAEAPVLDLRQDCEMITCISVFPSLLPLSLYMYVHVCRYINIKSNLHYGRISSKQSNWALLVLSWQGYLCFLLCKISLKPRVQTRNAAHIFVNVGDICNLNSTGSNMESKWEIAEKGTEP